MTVEAQAAPQSVSNYVPETARVVSVQQFTEQDTHYVFEMESGVVQNWNAGQFYEVSLFGIGEAPISICASPKGDAQVEMCVRRLGNVTSHIHKLQPGDTIGLRGPFGNGFDMDSVAGSDLIFAAGGLGLAPCRSFIQKALADRDKYGRIIILVGFRSPKEMLFDKDVEEWMARDDIECLLTVDRAGDDWKGRTGVITTLFGDIDIDPTNTWAFIIGPPVMFKFTVLEVLARMVPESRIICSLERRMKCGLGKCGHCQIRNVYVCQEGPIFTYQEVKRLREAI
jgi:sulfite reductase subunit B